MDIKDIIKPENLVYSKPRLMNDNPMHYCPGCSHGVVHKLVAEVIDEMGMEEKTIGVAPVGCAVFAYNYIDIDWIEAAHGRNTHGLLFETHLFDDLRNQFVYRTVTTAGAVVHDVVGNELRFGINQILLFDFNLCHSLYFLISFSLSASSTSSGLNIMPP